MFRGSEFASSFAQVRIGGKPGQMASADSGVEEERDIDAAGDNGKNPLLRETARAMIQSGQGYSLWRVLCTRLPGVNQILVVAA